MDSQEYERKRQVAAIEQACGLIWALMPLKEKRRIARAVADFAEAAARQKLADAKLAEQKANALEVTCSTP